MRGIDPDMEPYSPAVLAGFLGIDTNSIYQLIQQGRFYAIQ